MWFSKKAEPPKSDICIHDWSNWSAPETVEGPPPSRMAYNILGGITIGDSLGGETPIATKDIVIQHRCCLKCNRIQRVQI